jgi:outer membrane lipoprotein-sorting protein
MKSTRLLALIAFALISTALLTASKAHALNPGKPRAFAFSQKRSPAEILAATAERGKELVAALRGYTYYAEMTIQTVSQADTITGKFYRFSQISFDRNGNRQERVLENTSTLPKDVYIGTSSAYNLVSVYQFYLTPEALNQYEFNFVGREQIDELSAYVFDVKPRLKMPDPDKSSERYLKGRIWIDEQDLCVVKVAGEALPEQSERRTPKFETYFQNYDKYWFPAYASADDTVKIGRYPTRVIVKVRFTSYKKVTTNG